MLYRDGTTAQAGDLVIGKLPGGDKPLAGEVVCVDPGTGDLHLACPQVQAIGANQDLPQRGLHFGPGNEPYGVHADVAQAAAEHFDLLWRAETQSPAGEPPKPKKAGKKGAEAQAPAGDADKAS